MKILIKMILFIIPFVSFAATADMLVQIHKLTTTERLLLSAPISDRALVFDSTVKKLYVYADSIWKELQFTPEVVDISAYTGYFIIDTSGNKIINGIPFNPSQIIFVAHANVKSLNIGSDNAAVNNDNTLQDSFGTMNGFTSNDNGITVQQLIHIDGSGHSINDISRYASSRNYIGQRYANNDGYEVGKITALLPLFNVDGFTINITKYALASSENLAVLFTAYR